MVDGGGGAHGEQIPADRAARHGHRLERSSFVLSALLRLSSAARLGAYNMTTILVYPHRIASHRFHPSNVVVAAADVL